MEFGPLHFNSLEDWKTVIFKVYKTFGPTFGKTGPLCDKGG